MKTLALLGASGHGKVMAEIAELMGYEKIVFFDDKWPEKSWVGKWPIVGNSDGLKNDSHGFDEYAVAIGDNKVRAQKYEMLAEYDFRAATLIHPSSTISQYSKIGSGTVITAGSVVNVDSIIGFGCIVNTCATIDHDCNIGDFVHISPNASLAGSVTLGKCTWVGVGASIKQNIAVADNVVVGAGAVVVSNINVPGVVVGVPAKPIKFNR